jgi:hypothetical protein
MANDKKFIVKNGLETLGDVLIGTRTDDGVHKLQVEGASKITAALPSYPTLTIVNTTGTLDSPIIEFEGSSGALSVRNISTNDFGIFNGTAAAGNGIEFHTGNDGLIFKQAGAQRLKIENGNTSFTGLSTTNIEGRRIITTDDEARNGGNFDAATLDQLDSTQFVRSDQDDTMDGSYIITGNLTVQGVTTSINSEVVTIADNILQLNSNVTGAPTENSGIEIVRGTSANVQLIWNEASDWWSVGTYPFESNEIRSTNANDLTLRAPGSGDSNVNITAGFGTSYIGLKSVKVGLEGYGQVLHNNTEQLRATSQGIDISNDLQVDGDITVGDNNGAAQIFFNGTGLNSTLYSLNGEIGFLKQNLNYGAYLNSNEDWIVSGNNVAQGNIISEGDITAYDDIVANNNILSTFGNISASVGDVNAGQDVNASRNVTAISGNVTAQVNVTATTGNVAAGVNVTAGQDVDATRDVIAGRDLSVGRNADITGDLTANNATITNDLSANNATFFFVNANSAIIGDISANNIVADQDIRSGRFVDNDDDNYFGDFNQTSQMNRIDIDDYIRHRGDTDNYFGFQTNDTFRVWTGGTQRLNIDNNSADFSVGVYAPIYYDSNNTGYFVDPAGSSIMSNIFIDDYIYHAQSITDYFGFNAANDYRVVIGNVLKFNVTDSVTQSYNDVRAPRYYAPSGTTNFLDLDVTGVNTSLAISNGRVQIGNVSDVDRWNDASGNGGISLAAYGGFAATSNPSIAISGGNGGYSLFYLNKIDIGANPFNASNRYFDFYTDGTSTTYISGDTTGNLNFIPRGAQGFFFWDSGSNNIFSINSTGDVVVGNQTPTYTDGGDNTPLVGTNSAAKFHVSGSIYLNGANDAIIFGRGTGSFLKDEELAFGWGGGLYMTDATYLRVRNNKHLTSSGEATFSRYNDADNANYYADPAGDSQMNTIDIDDYIRHRGDTNTYFGFQVDDTFRVFTNGSQRLNIDNNSADFTDFVYAPRYYDSNNTAYYGDFASTSNMNRIDIDDYIRHRGDTDTYFGFPAADTIRFFTGNAQRFNLDNDSADFTVDVYAPRYYDSNNVAFYGDFASRSEFSAANFSFNSGTALVTNGFDVASTVLGAIHLTNGSGADATNGRQAAITFMGDSATTSQAGIYVSNNNSGGTAMAFATTDNYTTGPQIGLRIQNDGRVDTLRSFFQAAGSVRAPIFYDSDNTAFYGDFAGASRMSTIVLEDGVTLRSPNGDYGSFAIAGLGRNGYEGFSINDRMVFMHDNANRVGVYNDVDNEWIWYADRNAQMRLMYDGGEQARTENGYFLANNQMRSPIYYDSNNTAFYGDFAGTSITNIMRANRFEVGAASEYIDRATGNYGTIRVEGVSGSSGTYAGYAIRDDWVFMSDGPATAGIYNDTNNEWAVLARQNSRVELYFNGTLQAQTQSNHFDMITQARAPIYYDRNNTGYYGDFASHSRMSSISVGNQGAIANNTYAMSLYHNNRYLLALRYSGSGTAYPWLVHDTWSGYDGNARNALIMHYNGVGDRFYFDEQGNFFATNSVSAPSINLNGGNENLNLSPAYGTGMADDVLFDGTHYFDKRVINPLAPNENSLTTTTAEFVRATTGPFAGSYVLRSSGYRDFYTDFIPVEPGEELYGEISVRYVSGSGGILYYGIERYDQNKVEIAGNAGTTYFVVSGSNDTSTSWSTKRGYHTLPSNVYYVRIRILMNYPSGGALREFGGIVLKRSNKQGRLRSDNIYAPIYYDSNNESFYLDPASTSILNDVRASIYYDRDNTTYVVNPAGTTNIQYLKVNTAGSSSGTRALTIKDAGQSELNFGSYPGAWTSALQIQNNDNTDFVWISPLQNGTSARFRTGGSGLDFYTDGGNDTGTHSLFVGSGYALGISSLRAPIFYDSNNTGYFINPNSNSNILTMRAQQYINIGNNNTTYGYDVTNRPTLLLQGSYPHIHLFDTANTSNTTHGPVISLGGTLTAGGFRKWNIGVAARDPESIQIGYFDNQTNPHYGVGVNGWTYDSFSRLVIRTGYTEARGSMRSPLFYDLDNTGYYLDAAGDSRLNTISIDRANFIAGAPAYFYTSSGTLRGYIRATETNDNHFEFATSGGEDIIFRDGGFGGSYNLLIRGDGQVIASARMDAPIFYDSNNTGFYADPAATSSFATLLVDRINMRDIGDWITFYGDDSTQHAIGSYDNGGNVADDIRINTYGNLWINLDSNNNNSSSADFRIGRHGGSTGSIQNLGLFDVYGDALYVYTGFSFRSPIYYDSNNTGYYIDAASTSRLNTLLTNRLYIGYDNNTSIYLDYPNGDYGSVSTQGSGKGGYEGYSINDRYVFMSADNNQVGIYNDIDNEWILYAERNSYLYLYWNGRWEARTDNGFLRIERQARAPIYYDLNNTTYYLDPASTSNLNGLNVQSTLTSNGIYYVDNVQDYDSTTLAGLTNAPISTRNRDYNIGTTPAFLPLTHQTALYNSGYRTHVSTGLYKNASAWGDNDTGWYVALGGNDSYPTMHWKLTYGSVLYNSNNFVTQPGSFRAPIFYDSNNTGYYVDPSSFSNLNTGVRATDFYARDWFRNDNSGEGLYNQATAQHWYSDDDDYWNVAGGSSANGIRFRDEYAGTIRGYVYADSGNNVGILNQSGSWRMRIVSGDYGLFNGSSVRAPIFYDSNNTSYYFNGASDNSTRFRGVSNETMAFMGLSGQTRSSKEYYAARPRITSDQNYWTGAMGWGVIDMNTVANWGSGFIDSWGNPANQPAGASHWVGIQSYHYTNGSARYGWQMVGGPIGNLRFRNTWASFSSWRTIPILDVNDNNGGAMFAGIYYDANNTGYYTDPASTSNMNVISNEGQYGRWWEPKGVGGDSGNGAHAYRIFQEGGGWSYPYPDLRIAFHTGIKLGANSSYEGTRIYDDYPMGTIRWQFNGGSGYQYQYTWTNLTGYHGIYSGLNGAHFYPNPGSYGAWNVLGQRNGWYGLEFSQTAVSLMMNTDNYGFHYNGVGWRFYVTGGSGYFPGNVVAYWSDKRLKENIRPLESGEGLDTILKLVPSRFQWKESAAEVTMNAVEAGKEEVSLIAQEAQEILPNSVVINKAGKKVNNYGGVDGENINEYLTINYDKITPYLIQSIKDLKEELDASRRETEELKSLVRELLNKGDT